LFFFASRRRHTRSKRDWSSDVCSSDLNRIRIHDLRHSHASYLINKGFDIQIISKRLGHSKTSMTYDVYGHLYPNKEDEAIEVMEKEFGKSQVIELKSYHE